MWSYPAELPERAARLVAESWTHHDSKWAAITAVAAKWGVATAEMVRKWVRQVEIDAGVRAGVSSQESAHRDGDDLWRKLKPGQARPQR